MTSTLDILTGFLLYPGFIFSLVVGGMFYWFYRKVRARFQARRGPPWYQFFADLIKLFSKESIIPYSPRGISLIIAPIFSLMGLLLVVGMLPVGPTSLVQSDESLIVTLYFLAFPGLAVIMAGGTSGSPYGTVGSNREVRMMMGYELPYATAALTLGFYVKSLNIFEIVQYQFANGALFIKYPLATVAFLLSLLPMIGRRPFDAPEADTEIIGGPLTEYSGVLLGLFEIVNGIKWFVIPAFAVNLFFGGGANIIEFLLKCLGIVLLLSVIDIIYPRFRIDQGFNFFLKWALPLALIDFVRSMILPW
jgi:NADH-quinone oxidoreductase subunit H